MFTPDQCRQIIEAGRRQPPQQAQVGMGTDLKAVQIQRKELQQYLGYRLKKWSTMYRDLNKFIQKANENHFGFGDIQITENAQFTEYPEGGFYDWHMDCDVNMQHEPPVRKISMTLLLNDPSEFEGGDLELMAPGKFAELKQGHAICFASFLNHRVNPVKNVC